MLVTSCTRESSYKPTYRNLTEAVYASGVLRPKQEVSVIPSVAGQIKAIYVREGDTVKKGQILALIQNETPRASLTALEYEYRHAQANARTDSPLLQALQNDWASALEKAKTDSIELRRVERLFQQGVATSRQLELARTTFDLSSKAATGAKLRYESQRAQLATAAAVLAQQVAALRSSTGEYTLYSPIDGYVLAVNRKVGEWIGPPSVIMRIGSLGPMWAEVQIDEADASYMRQGLKVLLRPEGQTSQIISGVVRQVDPAVDLTSRTLKVLVEPDDSLYLAGLSLEANIIVREHHQVLTIPRSYLLAGDSVLVDRGRGIERQAVETGVYDLNYVQIKSGLDTSDRIFLPR